MKLWQKVIVVLCVGLIIFPPAVDLAHVFSDHKHDFCNHYAESHFHQESTDCELLHFQKQAFPFSPLSSDDFAATFESKLPPKKEYLFLSTYQKLHFSLRAPPTAV